jgi:hypothetical protein
MPVTVSTRRKCRRASPKMIAHQEELEPTIRGPDRATGRSADYIMALPKAEQKHEKWETAISCLIVAAEGRGPLMHARIGVMQALNRNVERAFTGRKDHHKDHQLL